MKRPLRAAAVLLLSMAGTLSLLLADADVAAGAPVTLYIRQTLASLAGGQLLGALVFTLLCVLNARTLYRPCPWRRGDRLKLTLLAAAFACVAAVSAASRADDGLMAGFFAPAHTLLLAGKAAGFFAVFWVGMKALLLALPALAAALRPSPAPAPHAVRRGFRLAWLLIAAAWLPSVLARFPGALTGDGGRVLQQFYGEIIITGDHPLAYTWLMGLVTSLGRLAGNDNLGLFLCTLAQWLALSAAMAWAAAELHREGFPRAVRYAVIAVFALSPLAMGNAAALIKDVPYSAAFIAFTVCFARAVLHPREMFGSWKWRVQYAAFALCLLMLRHNGIVTVLPASLTLLARLLRTARARRAAGAAMLAAPLLALALFNGAVVSRIAFAVDGTPDLLGVAIQQTARILHTYPDEATPARMAAIDRVLEADALADAYQPRQSDSVRKLYRYFNGHTGADVLAFAGIWAELALRHPLCAAQAFWSLNGGFLDPLDPTRNAFTAMMAQGSAKYPATLHAYPPERLAALQQRLLAVEDAYMNLPAVAQLQAIGLYVWALWVAWYLVRRTRGRGLAWLLLPAMATLFTCLLSAGYAVGVRYALPIAFTAPYLLCLLGRAILADARAGDTAATANAACIACASDGAAGGDAPPHDPDTAPAKPRDPLPDGKAAMP